MLHLIDAHGSTHRFFHGLPPMERPSDSHPIGVVHGVCTMLWRLSKEQPAHAIMVFDKGGSAARTLLDPRYKAQRQPPPTDLVRQYPLVRRAAQAFGFQCVDREGVEADDLIATYARLGEQAGHEVTVVSPDKDLWQLLRPGVYIFDPKKNIPIDSDYIRSHPKFGVYPEQIVDFLALVGDVSDNIKGVFNVGPKKAAPLLAQFGSLEAILDNLHAVKPAGLARAIEKDAKEARLAKKLVTLDQFVPVDGELSQFAYSGFDRTEALEFLAEMELVTLRGEIEKALLQAA